MRNKSLHFGLSNFFTVAQDESDGTYNYYGYVDKKGSVLIMRTNKTATELRYYVTTGTFSTIWSGKAGYSYVLPNQLEDQKYTT